MQATVFCFFAGGSGILNSNWHVWQWKKEAMLCEIHTQDFKAHFWRDFLIYCTRPDSVHLAMACVSCSFDSLKKNLFAQFKTTTKSHENYVFLYSFSKYLKNKTKQKLYFIPVNCMGWQECVCRPISGPRRFDSPLRLSIKRCRNGRTLWRCPSQVKTH